ncbi:hypothetical protein ACSDR0_44680, partial [Streptosporangium sp. G11]
PGCHPRKRSRSTGHKLVTPTFLDQYSGSTGKNCAIAKPISAWSGKVSHLQVQLSTNGYPGFVDDGMDKNHHYYAGPIYIPARGKCIDVGGFFDHLGQRYAGKAWGVHCG